MLSRSICNRGVSVIKKVGEVEMARWRHSGSLLATEIGQDQPRLLETLSLKTKKEKKKRGGRGRRERKEGQGRLLETKHGGRLVIQVLGRPRRGTAKSMLT